MFLIVSVLNINKINKNKFDVGRRKNRYKTAWNFVKVTVKICLLFVLIEACSLWKKSSFLANIVLQILKFLVCYFFRYEFLLMSYIHRFKEQPEKGEGNNNPVMIFDAHCRFKSTNFCLLFNRTDWKHPRKVDF